jgi:membrane protein DedA with SNARE-associated domain
MTPSSYKTTAWVLLVLLIVQQMGESAKPQMPSSKEWAQGKLIFIASMIVLISYLFWKAGKKKTEEKEKQNTL